MNIHVITTQRFRRRTGVGALSLIGVLTTPLVIGSPIVAHAQSGDQPIAGFAGGSPGLAGASVLKTFPAIEDFPRALPRLPESQVPRAPAPNPGPVAAPVAPPHDQPASSAGWSDVEVLAAKAHCDAMLVGLKAKFVYVPQMRDGACGTAAPIELQGFGKGNGIAISPPVIVNCDMAAALIRWFNERAQPAAQRHLRTSLVQINTMSSYSCRNRYGARKAPLSQHALANAVDVRGFVIASGELIEVEDHWGPTAKEGADYEVRLAAAKALSAQPVQAKATQAQTVQVQAIQGVQPVTSRTYLTTQSLARSPTVLPPSAPTVHGKLDESGEPVVSHNPMIKVMATGKVATMGAPSVRPGSPLDARAHFLRDVHGSGCGIFGTVLGPEANKAHRNHLHIDMASRKTGSFCQ